MQPDLLGNRLERPALLRQVADLLIAHAPVDAALVRRGRGRYLDDSGLVRESQGEHSGRHVDIL